MNINKRSFCGSLGKSRVNISIELKRWKAQIRSGWGERLMFLFDCRVSLYRLKSALSVFIITLDRCLYWMQNIKVTTGYHRKGCRHDQKQKSCRLPYTKFLDIGWLGQLQHFWRTDGCTCDFSTIMFSGKYNNFTVSVLRNAPLKICLQLNYERKLSYLQICARKTNLTILFWLKMLSPLTLLLQVC